MPLNSFDNVVPWEKTLYVDMLVEKVKEENEKLALKESARRAQNKR